MLKRQQPTHTRWEMVPPPKWCQCCLALSCSAHQCWLAEDTAASSPSHSLHHTLQLRACQALHFTTLHFVHLLYCCQLPTAVHFATLHFVWSPQLLAHLALPFTILQFRLVSSTASRSPRPPLHSKALSSRDQSCCKQIPPWYQSDLVQQFPAVSSTAINSPHPFTSQHLSGLITELVLLQAVTSLLSPLLLLTQ